MRDLEARLGRWIALRPWWIPGVCLLLVLVAGIGRRSLSVTNDYRVFFSPDNPQLLAFETLESTFTKNDSVMFVLAPSDGDVFTRETLSAVQALTEGARQIPYSTRVDSITNFQHSYAHDSDIVVHDLVAEIEALGAPKIAAVRSIR